MMAKLPRVPAVNGPGMATNVPAGPISYVIEWEPKPQYADQANLSTFFGEVYASSPAEAASLANREMYGPYRIARVFVAVEPVAWQPLDQATGSPLVRRS